MLISRSFRSPARTVPQRPVIVVSLCAAQGCFRARGSRKGCLRRGSNSGEGAQRSIEYRGPTLLRICAPQAPSHPFLRSERFSFIRAFMNHSCMVVHSGTSPPSACMSVVSG
ncbi:hypothetical protein OH77DRAFT_560521 [Trametes cingulata]|nr:hypothetical protein OH77DRAFT_560521 [Trametes cingulata]